MQILPELQSPITAETPILKADAIKFVTTFRCAHGGEGRRWAAQNPAGKGVEFYLCPHPLVWLLCTREPPRVSTSVPCFWFGCCFEAMCLTGHVLFHLFILRSHLLSHRSLLPKETLLAVFPLLITLLASEYNVVHSYAAIGIEKLLSVKVRPSAL